MSDNNFFVSEELNISLKDIENNKNDISILNAVKNNDNICITFKLFSKNETAYIFFNNKITLSIFGEQTTICYDKIKIKNENNYNVVKIKGKICYE